MMADEADVVDINRATVKDLETLFGIGRAKAEAIYTARMVKGTFTSLEELLTVPGIGRNVLEQNKDILVCEAVLDPVMEEAEDSLFHQEDAFRGDHSNPHHNRTSVDNSVGVNGPSIDGIEASYGTPPQVSSQTPPITNKPLPHTRRSSRRSSYHLDPVAATTSSSSASVSSVNTPASTGIRNTTTRISAHLAGKYLAAASSKAASTHCRTNSLHSIALYPGYSSSTITRNRQSLEPHFSSINLGANKNSNNDAPNLNEDSAMEWINDRETSENNLDVNRLNKPEGSSNGDIEMLNKRKFAINGSSCSGYLIADELGEAELNKLRVGENNYGEDNGENADLLYKDDSSVDDIDDSMHETNEEIAAALRRTARTATLPGNVGPSAVPGSDTPYEEPSEAQVMQVGGLSPSAADMDRLRAIYAAPSSAEDTTRSQSQSDVHDLSAAPSNIMVINMSSRSTSSGCINGLCSQSVSRQRKSSDSNSNNDFDHLTFSSVGSVTDSHPSTSRDSSNSSKCSVLVASGSYVQSIESLDSSLTHSEDSIVCVPDDDSPQSDDDDVDEDTDEELQEGADEDEHEQMVVESPILLSDKKQGKRKYEVAGEVRALLPVKKSCKAEELSPSGSVCSTSSVRRIAPIPTGLPSWLLQFSGWSPQDKLTALDHLIDVCDLNQVRHVHHIILPTFQRDFISLLPKELALYVLSYLTPKDLLKAAQTCKYWNVLTADNLLWREKCKEAGIDNFIDHMDKRRKKGTCVSSVSPYKTMFMRRHTIECNWRVNPLKEHRILKGHDDHVITCLQFSGNTIVSGSDDNTLKVWNATTSKCLRTLIGHTGGVWSSQMRDNIIVSGSTDRMLRVWDAETGLCKQTLYGHTSTVRCLHLHNNIVVSGSRDATLRVWDVTTGMCHHVLVGHVAAVRCVQYNGRLVVSGAYDFMVKVWNPDTEECLHTLQGHTNRVYSLQFDGIHVVSGSLDTTIRVWNVESGTCKHILMGHQSLTSGMELHNNILISGNADSTVKVWDILTGQCLQTLSGPNKHRSAVTCLQFINKFVVTSSDDGTVKLWDVSTGEFVRNLVTLDTGNSGGVVWRIRASDTKLVCAVGSRNGTEETKLLVLDFDVEET